MAEHGDSLRGKEAYMLPHIHTRTHRHKHITTNTHTQLQMCKYTCSLGSTLLNHMHVHKNTHMATRLRQAEGHGRNERDVREKYKKHFR